MTCDRDRRWFPKGPGYRERHRPFGLRFWRSRWLCALGSLREPVFLSVKSFWSLRDADQCSTFLWGTISPAGHDVTWWGKGGRRSWGNVPQPVRFFRLPHRGCLAITGWFLTISAIFYLFVSNLLWLYTWSTFMGIYRICITWFRCLNSSGCGLALCFQHSIEFSSNDFKYWGRIHFSNFSYSLLSGNLFNTLFCRVWEASLS